MQQLRIRPFDCSQDLALIPQITKLLHRAYAPLAAAGMRYMATHQSDDVTLRRLTEGESFLAFLNNEIVGTIALKEEKGPEACPWYKKDYVIVFGQFGVAPEYQGQRIGDQLMSVVEKRAFDKGYAEIALDTSEHAHQLIATYARRGYRFIEYTRWSSVNYRSVIMSKSLERMPVARPDARV